MSKMKLTATLAGLVLALTTLAGCAASTESQGSAASEKPAVGASSKPSSGVASKPVDNGPSSTASGTVETDANGTPVVYVVAEGDSMWGIESRFGIKDLADRIGINPGQIYPGDRLTLSP